MNSTIHSYNDLLVEKQRLSLVLAERKIMLTTELEQLKNSMKPVMDVIDLAGKVSSKDRSNPILSAGIDMGVNLLLKNVVLRNAGWVVKLLMPAMVKNYLSHEVSEKNNVFAKVGNFLKKKIMQHL